MKPYSTRAGERRNRPMVELEMHVHHETAGAFIASVTDERQDAVSLPKSQVDIVSWKRPMRDEQHNVPPSARMPGLATILMPEWLAIEKELV